MKPDRAKEILDNFAGKKIVVVGDAVIDHYIYGKVERLNPEAPVPILEAQEETESTGGAGNTAKNLAMLAADTVLVCVCGQDSGADRFEKLAKEEHYRALCIRDMSRPTIRKVRHIVGSQQLLRVDYEQTDDISGAVEEEIIAALEDEIKGADAVMVSDYAKGTITEKVALKVKQLADEARIPVGADIKPSRAKFFTGVSFISPNRKEAHEILGFNQHEAGGQAWPVLAEGLMKKMDCDVYLTLSADGMYVLAKDGSRVHVPQEHVVEVFDPSGAGDTAAAVILLARLAGASHQEVAELANAAGAFVVQKVGSVGVTKDDILGMIEHKHDSGR